MAKEESEQSMVRDELMVKVEPEQSILQDNVNMEIDVGAQQKIDAVEDIKNEKVVDLIVSMHDESEPGEIKSEKIENNEF